MGKSIFTIMLLIVSLLVITRIKTFIQNNKPVDVPEVISEDFIISTSTEIELQMQASTTDNISSTTDIAL